MTPASSLKPLLRCSAALLAIGFSIGVQADPITWSSVQAGVLEVDNFDFFGVTVANLPDGRFVLGQQGKVYVQNAWGAAASTPVANVSAHAFDPSFIAVRDADTALLGAGGFGAGGLHPFTPSAPASGVVTAILSCQNYAAAYWHSPAGSANPREGWLIAGANGTTSKHNVIFVSLDGLTSGAVTEELCTYSAGMAVDTAGNLYTALYELSGTANAADADKVLRFSAAQVETAVQAVFGPTDAPIARSTATFVHKFNGASSIAVDASGRVWAGGYNASQVEVYDPATGSKRTLVPVHGAINGFGPTIYQPCAFTRAGVPQVGFLAYDSWLGGGTPVFFVHASAADVTMPADTTFETWRVTNFSANALTLTTESTQWGETADPDHDGLPNVMEYALNTQPLTMDGMTAITKTMTGGLLAFSFPRNPLSTDLTYAVEVSSTLAANDWTVIASSTGGAATVASGAFSVGETTEGAMKRVTVTDQASAAGAARRFMRLRVTASTP